MRRATHTAPPSICDEDEQKKLGIKEMPAVGSEFPIQGVVKVIGTSERETQGGKEQDTRPADHEDGPRHRGA
jgi:hypothetical protein